MAGCVKIQFTALSSWRCHRSRAIRGKVRAAPPSAKEPGRLAYWLDGTSLAPRRIRP